MLSQSLGDSVRFVLDIKQARRSGIDPLEIVHRIGSKIVHLHLSDALSAKDGQSACDCLPIGQGEFDFAELFCELETVGFYGGAVVELYRENYSEYSQLADCVNILNKISKKA
jgi:sugar phosphate isomerase/epimerase